MGAGASVPDKIDAVECRGLAGDKFDQVRASSALPCSLLPYSRPIQAKFDELKDAEGYITKEQLLGSQLTTEATSGTFKHAHAWALGHVYPLAHTL